ncbi:MAG: transglutaminase domain-containing protein [Bacteroidota bacterium]
MSPLPTYRFLLLAVAFGPGLLWGQPTPGEEFENIREAHPEHSAVITDLWREVKIQSVGDSLAIIVEQYKERLVLANPQRYVKDRVYSSSFRELESIEAYTLAPGTKRYKKLPVRTFNRTFNKESSVFYDDSEVISYNYPQVDVGCKIVTRHSWRVTDPRVLGQFFFQTYEPTEKARFSIQFTENVALKVTKTAWKEDDQLEVLERSSGKGLKEYVYSASNLPALKYERDNPSFATLSPSVYARIAGYRLSSGQEVHVLDKLEDLYAWYRGFLNPLVFDPSLQDISRAIVRETDSDLEKVRKIFYWVQHNIQYVAFEQGMRGFIPHEPKYVLGQRYGDCKDMTSLLVGLLRAEGITADFAWVGTRDLPYRYSDLPSPLVDNHMVASVVIEEDRLFLDATGNYTPLGYPTSMIQGKQALIAQGEDYLLADVPIVDKSKNQMVDTVKVQMQDGDLVGVGKLTLTGLVRVEQSEFLVGRTEQEVKERLTTLLSKGDKKFFLEHYTLSSVADLDRPINIEYQFRIEDYYQTVGDEVYINLCLDSRIAEGLIQDRLTPKENDFKFEHHTVVVFDFPPNVEVDYLPENQSVSGKDFGFDVTYREHGRRLYVNNDYYVDFLVLPQERFQPWNEGLRDYTRSVRNSLVLKRIVE